MGKYLYRLTPDFEIIGNCYDTNNRIKKARIKRFKKLQKLFTKIYSYSIQHDSTIKEILDESFGLTGGYVAKSKIREIRSIQKTANWRKFDINSEFLYFNDFILQNMRIKFQNELNKFLPNRFESAYFFNSIEDCKKYCKELGWNINCYLNKVEILETRYFFEFDNKYLCSFDDSFTAKNFDESASNFLLGKRSSDPIIEVVFSGKIKIISSEKFEYNAVNTK